MGDDHYEDMEMMISIYADELRKLIEGHLKELKPYFADEAAEERREIEELVVSFSRSVGLHGSDGH